MSPNDPRAPRCPSCGMPRKHLPTMGFSSDPGPFPLVTVRDMIKWEKRLKRNIGCTIELRSEHPYHMEPRWARVVRIRPFVGETPAHLVGIYRRKPLIEVYLADANDPDWDSFGQKARPQEQPSRPDEPACRSPGAYRPAMEFATRVDPTGPIVTFRRADKWAGRLRSGDVIECEMVHQRRPGRWMARVVSVMDWGTTPPEGERLPYEPGAHLVRIRLEPTDADRADPQFRTWETKTTRLQARAHA